MAQESRSSQGFKLDRLDHLVLTVKDIEKTVSFYVDVMGMTLSEFKGGRKALHYGKQKINLHQAGREFEPKAHAPTPGSADLCFITATPLSDVTQHLMHHDMDIVEGPVERTGATGRLLSVYVRDPDLNLIEISNYIN